MVSCEIPWDEQQRLLEDVFRREIRMMLAHFNHLYIFGTAGEGYAVDTPRFQQIVQVFYEETRAVDVYPMVGVIGLSTATIIERIAYAYDIGFRVFQLSLPAWGALNNHELMTFFGDVCGAGCYQDTVAMFKLQKEFHDLLYGLLGPLLAEGRIDGAYDKLLVRLGGLEEMPLRLLSPYQG